MVNIASQYLQVLAQLQSVNNRRLNLSNMASLTERTTDLFGAGRLNFLEVQRSLQSQFSAESALIDAQEQFQTTLDNFKLTIGMPVHDILEIVPVELEVIVPAIKPDDAVQLAYRYRLELKTASDQIEDAQRSIKNAENGLLPDLNLALSTSIGNQPNVTPAVRIDEQMLSYSAGLTLNLPVDRVAERNIFRRALVLFQRARRNYGLLEDQIAAQVRDGLRSIRASELSVEIARQGIELAQRRLEFSNALLQGGTGETRDVVESQTSLLDAQDSYERAKATLQTRILEYMRDTGTLRVDPQAGSLGQAMDRGELQRREKNAVNTAPPR